MDATHPLSQQEALRAIPDTPATLEIRAVALDSRSAVYRSGNGLLAVDPDSRMFGAIGAVAARDLDRLYQHRATDCELLADRPAYEQLRKSYEFERAIIQTLHGAWKSPELEIAGLVVRPLAPADSIDHLPGELRGEIDRARQARSVIAGFTGGPAVSFAYCASHTETLSDISIDTLEEHRGRGIGAVVVSALIERIFREGRAPVWGAVEDNHASLRLAEKLGFTRQAGELFVHD